MAFFDKIGDFAKSVGDKTGGMIEITKLKGKIRVENDSIIGLQTQIGALFWSKYCDGEQFDEDANQLLEQIKAGFDRIDKLQEEIEAINRANQAEMGVNCKSCGSVNPPGTQFCGTCGTKVEEPELSEMADELKCPDCGILNSADTSFCIKCGANLENARPRLCVSCGVQLNPDSKFCGNCGQKAT